MKHRQYMKYSKMAYDRTLDSKTATLNGRKLLKRIIKHLVVGLAAFVVAYVAVLLAIG